MLPLPTPFSPGGNIDAAALAANIKRWSSTGIVGLVMLGSTGERVHLDEAEYLHVIELARASVSRDLAFIIGAGQQSTRGTINEVKVAAAAGADAALVITPSFYRSAITQDALISHYTSVADAAQVPVLLYSMPALTGITIEPETIARLSEHQNILGVKDSSADVERLKRTVELVHGHSSDSLRNGSSVKSVNKTGLVDGVTDEAPARSLTQAGRRDDFVILTGNGTVLHKALRAGAEGGILAVGCVVPELCIEIFRAFKAGENELGATLQEKLTPLAQAVTTKHGIGGLKAALDMTGYVGGAVRGPLRSPDEEARREISGLLTAARAVTSDYSVEAAEA